MWFATIEYRTPPSAIWSQSQSPYGAMWFATPLRAGQGVPCVHEVAIPLRGYVVCNSRSGYAYCYDCYHGRNPLTGLCGLQRTEVWPNPRTNSSGVAIPLRGYVVCNPDRRRRDLDNLLKGRNPLTGLCGLQLLHQDPHALPQRKVSQSPYGAMWFATKEFTARIGGQVPRDVAIPLRGYVVCNRTRSTHGESAPWAVAIPLRGYVVCNLLPMTVSVRGSPSCRNPLTGLCGLQHRERPT